MVNHSTIVEQILHFVQNDKGLITTTRTSYPVPRIPHPEPRTPNLEPRIPNPEPRTPHPEPRIPDSWFLSPRSSKQNTHPHLMPRLVQMGVPQIHVVQAQVFVESTATHPNNVEGVV